MNKYRLEYEMKRKGVSTDDLCAQIGMSKASFYRKTSGASEFTLSEIQKIVDLLGLASPIDVFFADTVS